MGDVVSHYLGRTALSKRIFTGLQPRRLGKLVAELAGTWMAAEESRLRERRGHERLRAPGAGPDHELVFAGRVIVTLVALRFQLPHAALAELCRVDRSTVTRAIREVRPLLAARGFAVPGRPGLQLRTLADVFAYASAHGVELRLDGTEVQVRRPRASKPGRRAFVSGKKKMNTKKATVVTDGEGRTLWAGAFRPGRMHDQTAVRTEGIADLFERFPEVKAKVDAGYRGLAKEFPGQVQAPPLRPKKDATPEEAAAWDAARHQQSSERICVEHANAEHKQWRTLQRFLGRREDFDETYTAVAGRFPTAPPRGDHQSGNPPGQHAPTSIAHHVVTTQRRARPGRGVQGDARCGHAAGHERPLRPRSRATEPRGREPVDDPVLDRPGRDAMT